MENNESTSDIKKIALYCRVSTNKQTNENQKVRLLQYATDKCFVFFLKDSVCVL